MIQKNTNNQYDTSEQLYYKSYFNNRLNYKKKITVDDLLFIPVLITTFWASALMTSPHNAQNECNITNTFVKLVLSMSKSPHRNLSIPVYL